MRTVLGLVLVALALPALAQAASPPRQVADIPAVDQYLESVPGAGGPHTPAAGGVETALPPAVAPKLADLVPPQQAELRRLARVTAQASGRRAGATARASEPGLFAAFASALGGSGLTLAGSAAVIAAALLAASRRRDRSE